jgi:hypothetical protein
MKVRQGFVSNSSSASFTCVVCNSEVTGYDCLPEDFDWKKCENQHTICFYCLPKEIKNIKAYIPGSMCPICSFEDFLELDISFYLKKKYKITKDDALREIKKTRKKRNFVTNSEYIMFVCSKMYIPYFDLPEQIRKEFKDYHSFYEYCHKNK